MLNKNFLSRCLCRLRATKGAVGAAAKSTSAGKFWRDGNGIEKGAERVCFGMREPSMKSFHLPRTTFDAIEERTTCFDCNESESNERPVTSQQAHGCADVKTRHRATTSFSILAVSRPLKIERVG